jgi:hypothetical protein
VHARRLDLDAAIACARTALSLDPQRAGAHMALAEALLIRGDLPEGFREYEWRFRLPGAAAPLPATDRPQWDGTPLPDGTLLLVADQGFGDVIQFCRYIPWVRTRAPHVVIACATVMQGVVRQVAPDVPMFAKWADCPPYAAYAAFTGLPLVHGTVLGTIPADIPYLHADPALTQSWGTRIDSLARSGRRVGLVWAGRPTHANDRNRSVSLARLSELFDCRGISFVALQKGQREQEAGRYYGRAPLMNLGMHDFADTAAIIANLDLVLSVDTSMAHLSAAMGKPTWIMLCYAPDWRWLLGRDDSAWYPTVRLFRQAAPGDWEGVAHRVSEALASWQTGVSPL